MRRDSPVFLVLNCLTVAVSLITFGSGFVIKQTTTARTTLQTRHQHRHSRPLVLSPLRFLESQGGPKCSHNKYGCSPSFSLKAKQGGNDDDNLPTGTTDGTDPATATDNFDGEGFAKYLLPYAVALIGSVLATAAMFKFVLLDY